ncbi:unnamed protein product [Closterium sp. NIES-65]|nr:unnamed protein product [Closterium sp. NIES-65]
MSLLLRLQSLSSYVVYRFSHPPRFPSHQPRFLPPSSSSSHRRPPFSPTSFHVVITPLPITFPLFTIASPPLSPTLGGEVWRAGLGAGKGVVTRSLWGGDEALEQSVGGTARAARAGGQQGVQCCRGRVRGAGEAGMRERGCRDPSIPLIPCHTFTSCPPPLLRSVVPPQPSSSPSPFLPSSISLPHYPLYPLCCPSSLPPVLPSSHPPIISSPHHLIRPSSHPPIISSPHHLIPPSSHPPIISSPHHLIPPSSHPPIISSPHHHIPPSSHPPIISSPHHLIRPSSHPPIISSPHLLIPPSSHPPIISSAHHLIPPSSHPPIISSAHHLIPPSSHLPIISSALLLSAMHPVVMRIGFDDTSRLQ